MQRERRGFPAPPIAATGAAVHFAVRIEDLPPESLARHTDPVADTRNRTEIANDRYAVIGGAAFTQEADHITFTIVGIDPFETGWVVVAMSQGRFATIKPVQVTHQQTQGGMRLNIEQRPVERAVVVPF